MQTSNKLLTERPSLRLLVLDRVPWRRRSSLGSRNTAMCCSRRSCSSTCSTKGIFSLLRDPPVGTQRTSSVVGKARTVSKHAGAIFMDDPVHPLPTSGTVLIHLLSKSPRPVSTLVITGPSFCVRRGAVLEVKCHSRSPRSKHVIAATRHAF